MKLYGTITATYFDELCDQALEERKQLFIGVSGGQSILDMVNSLIDRPRSNVHFYAAAMIGRGSSMATSHVGPEVNATIAWTRSGRFTRQLFYGTVPPYSASRELGDAKDEKQRHTLGRREILKQARILRQTDDVQSALQEMNRNINVAIAGLGLPTEDAKLGSKHVQRITMTGLLRPLGIDPAKLADEGAIGDISYNLYDDQGNGDPNWRFFLTVGDGSKTRALSLSEHGEAKAACDRHGWHEEGTRPDPGFSGQAFQRSRDGCRHRGDASEASVTR